MAVALSTFAKLQNLVAGSGKIYGRLRPSSGFSGPVQLSLYSTNGIRYEVVLYTISWTEMTSSVPSNQDGRDLLLDPSIETMVNNNALLIADEDEIDTTLPQPITTPSGTYATSIIFEPGESGLTATNVQEALDQLDAHIDLITGQVGHTHSNLAVLNSIVDAGSGLIITSTERTNFGTAYSHSQATGNPHGATSAQISYDHTVSGMSATTVKAAIDELDARVDTLPTTTHSHTNLSILEQITNAGSGSIITSPERTNFGTAYTHSQATGNAHNAASSDIPYNNTISGLISTNVKTALDEINAKVVTAQSTLTTLQSASHTHNNKTVLDGITNVGSGLIITSTERTNFGTAYTHSQTTGNPHGATSAQISYDHTVSGLAATDVKAAIDEVAAGATITSPQEVIYVAKNVVGSPNGSFGKPYNTLASAIASISSTKRVEFRVGPGLYDEDVVLNNSNILNASIRGSGPDVTRFRSLELNGGRNHNVYLDGFSIDQPNSTTPSKSGILIGNPGSSTTINLTIDNVVVSCNSTNRCLDVPTYTAGTINVETTSLCYLNQISGSVNAIRMVNSGSGVLTATLRGRITAAGTTGLDASGSNITITLDGVTFINTGNNQRVIDGSSSTPTAKNLIIRNSYISGTGSTARAVSGNWSTIVVVNSVAQGSSSSVTDLVVTATSVRVGGVYKQDYLTQAVISGTTPTYTLDGISLGYTNAHPALTSVTLSEVIDELADNTHNHNNKTVLDGITNVGSGLIITNTERTNFGTAYSHSQATGNAHNLTPSQLSYTPTSPLVATDVAGALDELTTAYSDVQDSIDTLSSTVSEALISPQDLIYVAKNVISGANGSAAKPYNTIAAAIASISSAKRVEFRLAPGVYDEDVVFNNSNITSATIRGSGVDQVVIRSIELTTNIIHDLVLDELSVDQSRTTSTSKAGILINDPTSGKSTTLHLNNVLIKCTGTNRCLNLPTYAGGTVTLYTTNRTKMSQTGTAYVMFFNNTTGNDQTAYLNGEFTSNDAETIWIEGSNWILRCGFGSSFSSTINNHSCIVARDNAGVSANRIIAVGSTIQSAGTSTAILGSTTNNVFSHIQLYFCSIKGGTTYEINSLVSTLAVFSFCYRVNGSYPIRHNVIGNFSDYASQSANIIYSTSLISGDILASDNITNVEDMLNKLGNLLGRVGTTSFNSETSQIVGFSIDMPDTNYAIAVAPVAASAPAIFITSKTESGFTINTSSSFTGNIDWIVLPYFDPS